MRSAILQHKPLLRSPWGSWETSSSKYRWFRSLNPRWPDVTLVLTSSVNKMYAKSTAWELLPHDDCVGNECSDIVGANEASRERGFQSLWSPEEERCPPVRNWRSPFSRRLAVAVHCRVLSSGKLVRGSSPALYYRATLSLITGTAYCQTWTSWNGVNGTGLNLTYPHHRPTLCWTKRGNMKHYAPNLPVSKAVQMQKKNFHLHFSFVWIGSRSTFVLCTALLTAEYTEGDRAQSEGQQYLQAL